MTNPCSQNWDEMQPSGAGRFCDRCEKNIIDLTTKSDAELMAFFKKKNENVCGRLLSSQLNRELLVPRSMPAWQYLLPLAMAAIAVSPAQAKALKPVIAQDSQSAALARASARLAVKKPLTLDTIRGSVVDERTGRPLLGVKVRQKGFENVLAITDSAGRFELGIKQRLTETAITFELNGYSRLERNPVDNMIVKLTADRVIMVGGVSSITLNQAPLYLLIVGKKSCSIDAVKLSEIPPAWIEKIEVLKDAKATSIYGAKAANGVVIIEINKAYAKKMDFLKK